MLGLVLIGLSSCQIINFGTSKSNYYKKIDIDSPKSYVLDIETNEKRRTAKVRYDIHKNKLSEVTGYFEKAFVPGSKFRYGGIEYVFRYAHHDFNEDEIMDFIEFSPDYYWEKLLGKKNYRKETIWIKIRKEKN